MALAIQPTAPITGKQAKEFEKTLKNNPKKGTDKVSQKITARQLKKLSEFSRKKS